MTADGAPELAIPPVLVLSTGRCGSTMVSEMLNKHPGVLSLSEFFVPLGAGAWARERPDGEHMWRLYSRQSPMLHAMLQDGIVVDEALYPYDDPGARYGAGDMPPILAVTLPHLTDRHEALFDELEPLVRSQPRRPAAEHYRFLFEHLAGRFGRRVWVERSGGSLMHAAKLLRWFPDARVIHVFRDGRDTALSMAKHNNFRVLVGSIERVRRVGLDPTRGFLSSRGGRAAVWTEALAARFMDLGVVARGDIPVTAFAAFWSRLIEVGKRVFGAFGPDRLLNVRFEDVQAAPRERLRELIRFIHPSLEDEAWLEQAAAMVGPARSSYRTLPPGEQRTLTDACRPGLEALGYPL